VFRLWSSVAAGDGEYPSLTLLPPRHGGGVVKKSLAEVMSDLSALRKRIFRAMKRAKQPYLKCEVPR
jgi:hypothetical protein